MARLVQTWTVLSLILMLAGSHGMYETAATDQYEVLRLRWKDSLTGGTAYNSADPDVARKLQQLDDSAQYYWHSLDISEGRTNLWGDLTSTNDPGQLSGIYSRLRLMALAYATKGSAYAGSTALKDDIIGALDWAYTNRYNEHTIRYGNWWDWEIGVPLALNDIVTLLYEQLTPTQITNYMAAVDTFAPVVKDTGANLVWRATVVGVRGAIVKDNTKLSAARDGLSPIFPTVITGDGFYQDGSFIQHSGYPYNGGYGQAALLSLANLLALLNGSPWTVTDSKQQNVYRWVYESFEPLIYNGAMMDMVRGRDISRPQTQDHVQGHIAMMAVIRLAQSAPISDALAYRQMVKTWLTADTYRSFYSDVPLPIIIEAKAISDNQAIVPRGELTIHRQFGAMDRAVQLRPGYGFGISMSSSRISNYESINNENLRGWYTAEGMTYLYNGDQAQYSDDFWATINPYRLPGTTVDTQSRGPASGTGYRSSTAWVGGVDLAGTYGTAGMDLRAWNSTLEAKKSWFMFDNEIVALGTGITSIDNRTIETIVEDRKLNAEGSNALMINGAPQSAAPGWAATLEHTAWAHIEGTGGYYFPGAPTIKGARETRTGSWNDINQLYGPAASITRHYLELWFDHGTNPSDQTYAYVMLPNRTASETDAYAANPDVSILANTSTVQAARDTRLGILAANFWKPGSVDYLRAITPSAVMIQNNGYQLEVSASDPTQLQTTIIFELSGMSGTILSQDPTVTVLQLSPSVVISVNVAGSQGATHSVKFAMSPINPASASPSPPVSSPPPIGSVPQSSPGVGLLHELTLVTTGDGRGTVVPSGGMFQMGTRVPIRPEAAVGSIFTGWKLDGVDSGWATPLNVTMDRDHVVLATFAIISTYTDVQPDSSAYEAIMQLAARRIIRGYPDGTFGPEGEVLRAHMAALIARAMGWDTEEWGNPFIDRGPVDDILWRNVGTLAHYGIAMGYGDGTFGPMTPVLRAQVISFISRAMVEGGRWKSQPDNMALSPGVPLSSGHRADLATYIYYVGQIPRLASTTDPFTTWDHPATREWFALALWQALSIPDPGQR